ncbi:glycine cleavage system protein T [Anaerobacillus alkalilacustris]|uniref:Aminomethyltransferase n=1 Tax=Anaerobacillus alkalilacustris TaxID=393763 RepID=A0A1S2LFZ5_9BACI|nr:glycine cleavage system aminomethyltransferase GcvT [Anaerobacillus alkalilacustris]OIJ11311.1 glycine cleavage system protein T [Anaerobacillus alkalilacustris]
MSDLKRTPLFEIYKEYGGKTIDFGGWELPVQFSSIKEEHEAVRERAGLFDVSHMGEFLITGIGAENFLQKLVTNDVSKLKVGAVQYTAMCYKDGGTVDDLIIYKRAENEFLVVVNASNIEKDFQWMEQQLLPDVELKNVSKQVSQLALQGPLAEKVLQKITKTNLADITFFTFRDEIDLQGVKALVSRTGYTGEDGFEIYCNNKDVVFLWRELLEAGKDEGVIPCGLGARDTLRFEARLPLYGQELTKDITPIEAGIGFAVKVDKEIEFIGKEILKFQKEKGVQKRLVGIEMIEKGIPRTGYEVFVGEEKVGFVTSGTHSPTLKKSIGLALVDIEFAPLNTLVEVQIRKKRLKAKVVCTPFYKRS